MFKKYFLTLTGFIVIIVIGLSWMPHSSAEGGNVKISPIIKKCETEFPDFLEKDKNDKEEKSFSDLEFRIKFEKTRNAYHEYIQCIFDESAKEILGSAGGNIKAIWTASTPNIPELLKPEVACLKQENLTKIINHSSPKSILPTLLNTHGNYATYLNNLSDVYERNMRSTSSNARIFAGYFKRVEIFDNLITNEIQDSLVGMDIALGVLKEMRQAFVMHVHFQCMLKNLGEYRKMLENIRTIVMLLPSKIIDASMSR